MSGKQRILTALKTGRLVTQKDFNQPTIDGLGEIPFIPRRIRDLRNDGHDILTTETPAGTCAYKLLSTPSATPGTVLPAATPENGVVDGGNGTVPGVAPVLALFGSAATRNAIYGEEAA